MSTIIRRPLNSEDKKILDAKTKPTAEEIQRAADELFLNLLTRVAELEAKENEVVL